MYISKKDREIVKNMFGSRCAYTGTDLLPDWQVDHVKALRRNWWLNNSAIFEENHNLQNMLPSQRIINHYKHSRDLDEFRDFMKDFHLRIAKLPKNPKVLKSVKRKAYMLEVARMFGITPNKPFSGKFWFETFKPMKILVGCEESQAVCIELRKLGHEAFSCDLEECSGGHPEWHLQMDVFEAIKLKKWDAAIFFPPCTYLTVTGARWLYNRDGSKNIPRWESQKKAIEFVKKLYYSDIKRVAIENPVGKLSSLWMKPTQIIQPYYFGDEAQKTTCLWLKNLPPLIHNKEPNLFDENVTHVDRGKQREYINNKGKKRYMSEWYWETSKGKGKERQTIRSKTFPGIAKAMANQWSEYLIKTTNT